MNGINLARWKFLSKQVYLAYAKVFVVDDILDSMNMCKAFTIISTKAKEIDDFIMTEMKRKDVPL